MTAAGRPSVALMSLGGPGNPTLLRLQNLTRLFPPAGYTVVGDADHADIILLVENGYVTLESILAFSFRRRKRGSRAYIFSEGDLPICFAPGLYCSMTQELPWAQSWSYLLEQDGQDVLADQETSFLYSFLGRVETHPVREQILALDTPGTPCLDVASGPARFVDWHSRKTYQSLIASSRFVLCPRGFGASSIRIFEAMRAGRVPVIIGDSWMQPPVGDWSRFSLRVPEASVARIPDLCAERAGEAEQMGNEARETFERYFAPATFLDAALNHLRVESATADSPPALYRVMRSLSLRDVVTAVNRLVARETHRA